MSRLARPADRLATGSSTITRRLDARTTAWIARGRRDDLTGWRAALGVIVRILVVLLGGYLLWRLVRAVPALMWLITGTWIIAAWRAGKPALTEAVEQTPADTLRTPAEEAPAGVTVETLRGLLLDLMGEGSGVHLRTVLAHLQEHGQWGGRTVTDLRVHLERLGVPVSRSVKVAGVPTWGVRRRDLDAPSPESVTVPSSAASTAA